MDSQGTLLPRKLCDKCRNHNEVSEKRGHGGVCPHERCQCELCRLTDKRRRVTKYLQRIRRAKVTSEEMDMIWKEMNDQRLEPPPAPQHVTKEDIRSSCGQPVQQFVSCLLPESMSQNEIRHFLYPRPHLPEKPFDADLNSFSARSVSTDVLNNEKSTSGTSNLVDGDVGESSVSSHNSVYPLNSQRNERPANIAENCPVKTSFKELCMADKKKIVEGKNGSFREFMDYSDQLSENVVASSSVFRPTLNEENRAAREAVVRCEKTIDARRACDDYVMKNRWPGQNESMDNAMNIVRETHPSAYANFKEIEEDAVMDEAVNFQRNSDVSQKSSSQAPVSPPLDNKSQVPVSPTLGHQIQVPVSPPLGHQIQASVSPPSGNQSRNVNQVRRSYVKRRKRKRTQSCTFCQNHGFTIPKPGHKCPYNLCECLLCRLTKIARVVMKHQQALWRHQAREFKKSSLGNLTKLRQVCDKCRNHNLLYKKSGHTSCAFEKCTCPLCTLTDKRRYVMMHLQRIRRAQVTSKALSSDEDSDCDGKTNRKTKSDLENFESSEENQSVAAVIDSVTQALKALPQSLQSLTSDLHIDSEQEAHETRSGAPRSDVNVLNPDPTEDNQLMEMEENGGSTSGPELTQL